MKKNIGLYLAIVCLLAGTQLLGQSQSFKAYGKVVSNSGTPVANATVFVEDINANLLHYECSKK